MVRDGLARTGYDEVALTSLSSADFSGIDGVVADLVNDQVGHGQRQRVAAEPAGRRVQREDRDRDPEGAPHRADVRARGRLVAAAPGDQQADPRGGSLQRRRCCVLAGLAPGEALLPHRPAHRDGRRHARDRASWRRMSSRSGAGTPSRRAARCRSAGSCPSRTRRSSGSARTASTSWTARSPCCGTRPGARKAQVKWHDPSATFAEGIVSRGDRRIGRVIEAVWRAGGTFQEWSEHFSLDRWTDAMQAEGLDPDWYVTRHRTRDEVLPWDHIAAGLHHDFLWDDWQAALAEHGLPDCRWTPCYDCGVCTDYALEHVVASPLAPAGGSQGTGQDLGARRRRSGPVPRRQAGGRARSASRQWESGHEGRGGQSRAAAVHEAGQGPLDLAPRRRPGARAGIPDHAAPARVHRGVLAPTEGELRVGALDRARERRGVPRSRVRRRGRARAAVGVAHRGVARRYGCYRRSSARRSGRRRCKKR